MVAQRTREFMLGLLNEVTSVVEPGQVVGACLYLRLFLESAFEFKGFLCHEKVKGGLLRPRTSLAPAQASGTPDANWFLRGLLGNVLNPKVGIFYVSFLPQFIPQGQSLIAWTFGLVGIHVALSLVWALLLIGATQPLGHWLRREVVIKWMDRSTGLIFVLFAARLALSRR